MNPFQAYQAFSGFSDMFGGNTGGGMSGMVDMFTGGLDPFGILKQFDRNGDGKVMEDGIYYHSKPFDFTNMKYFFLFLRFFVIC